MSQQNDPTESDYPHGRGYGHDYMRGGEVLGGYGYSARAEYERPRGDLGAPSPDGSTAVRSDGQDTPPPDAR